MYKISFFFILTFLFSVNCFSQIEKPFLSLDKSDLPEGNFKPARTFTGESLFGYINGGAELFLEYGFSSAWVAEISLSGGKYKTEIYRMNGAEEAFGIFSVSRFKCTGLPPVSKYSCHNKYQLQICSGEYYISIINSTGSRSDSLASLAIGEAVVRKISTPSFNLSEYFPGLPEDLVNKTAVLVKGKLGLMNGATEWEDYFKGADNYCLVIFPGESFTSLSVKFNTRQDLINFCSLHGWKVEDLSSDQLKMINRESIRKLKENHLLIEVPR